MALIADIRVNLDQIGYVAARRVSGSAGGRCVYDCRVVIGGEHSALLTVEHDYDDGALVLIRRVLEKWEAR